MVAAVDDNGLGRQRGSNKTKDLNPASTNALAAEAALDRLSLPHDIQVRIAEVVKPGSTLILSDYDMSRSETSKGTDIIVQMPEVVANVAVRERKKKRPEVIALGGRGGEFGYSAGLPYAYYYPKQPVRVERKPSSPLFSSATPKKQRAKPFYRSFSFDYLD
jgi:hypothetical protein